jgi:hypothetical protein
MSASDIVGSTPEALPIETIEKTEENRMGSRRRGSGRRKVGRKKRRMRAKIRHRR